MHFTQLKCFQQIVESGNYVSAGVALGLSSTAVGRNLRELEKKLGCTLFKRNSHGFQLTEEGKLFLEFTSKVFSEFKTLQDMLNPDKSQPRTVKILSTVGIVSDWTAKFVPNILMNNPNINLEIRSVSSTIAYDVFDYDIYIGSIDAEHQGFDYKYIKDFHYNFYASPSYIEIFGEPKNLKELQNHRIIEFNIKRFSSYSKFNSHYEYLNFDQKLKVMIDSTIGEFQLAEAGAGIAYLCNELSYLKHSHLVQILKDISPTKVPMYFVTHERLREDKLISSIYKKVMSSIDTARGI